MISHQHRRHTFLRSALLNIADGESPSRCCPESRAARRGGARKRLRPPPPPPPWGDASSSTSRVVVGGVSDEEGDAQPILEEGGGGDVGRGGGGETIRVVVHEVIRCGEGTHPFLVPGSDEYCHSTHRLSTIVMHDTIIPHWTTYWYHINTIKNYTRTRSSKLLYYSVLL